jgi:Uma2 family endonuclease
MATTVVSVLPDQWTVADMVAHLGDIPLSRIRMVPPPGTATEKDVLEAESRFGCICELIDGVLVEKTMGWKESLLAVEIAHRIRGYLETHDLGDVLGADGTLRILPQQVRVPDVCFLSWQRFPGGERPQAPIPPLAPDLAVEILSPGNTEGEMRRKLRDYFTAGVRLVWYVDPATRSARAYTAPDQCVEIGEDGSLSGGDVLPEFTLPLRELFARAERGAPPDK